MPHYDFKQTIFIDQVDAFKPEICPQDDLWPCLQSDQQTKIEWSRLLK